MKRIHKALICMMLLVTMFFVAGCTPENNDNDVRVTTYTPQDITRFSAVCGGDVIVTQGLSLTELGVCWSTSRNPTVDDAHLSTTNWSEPFVCTLYGLEPDTRYHVRAYALRGLEYYYGDDKSFVTEKDDNGGGGGGGGSTVMGALPGVFTVDADGRKVHFSQGNLQYVGSSSTWKFADNQWDVIGESQGNSDQSATRDLFGWGTSGYNHGANCYQPWSTSMSYSDYYAYGSYSYNLFDQTGQADWGYNAISNGGNQTNLWRTLTAEEWNYVFYQRSTNSGIRYAKAKVNNVNGVILLPDDWQASYYSLNSTNTGAASFSTNVITASQWATLELHGAVFLPAAGYRYGTSVDFVGSGYYWSASCNPSRDACYVYFYDGGLDAGYYGGYRGYGLSVRLVRTVENYSIHATPSPAEGGAVSGAGA